MNGRADISPTVPVPHSNGLGAWLWTTASKFESLPPSQAHQQADESLPCRTQVRREILRTLNAARHLDDMRAKMRELKALERSLVSFVEACDTSCAGGPGPDCVILGDLGKHCGCAKAALLQSRRLAF